MFFCILAQKDIIYEFSTCMKRAAINSTSAKNIVIQTEDMVTINAGVCPEDWGLYYPLGEILINIIVICKLSV